MITKKGGTRKRILSLVLAALMIFTIVPTAVYAQDTTALPSNHPVMLDGRAINPTAFNIGGNNFFMLRDVAYLLNGTAVQFEVTWNGALNAINLITGQAYTPIGGEMTQGTAQQTTATPTTATVYIDGTRANLTAFNIGGNNFFMLRDLGEALGFGVDWDAGAGMIVISTVSEAIPPNATTTISETVNPVEFERRVFELLNAERISRGLNPLIWDDNLANAARGHSTDMRINNFSGHGGSDGSSPSQRAMRSGWPNSLIAENAFAANILPQTAFDGWMASSGHQRNMLNPIHTHVGIGFDGTWTMKLGRPNIRWQGNPPTTRAGGNFSWQPNVTQDIATMPNTPLSWSMSGNLPAGIFLNADTGYISGRPTEQGRVDFSLIAYFGNGIVAERSYFINVQAMTRPTISAFTPNTPWEVGQFQSKQIVLSGGEPMTLSIESGTLPPGVTFDPITHTISGTPTQRIAANVRFRVENEAGSSIRGYTFRFR